MDTYRKVYDFAEIIPVSALRAQNLDTVLDQIFKYLPWSASALYSAMTGSSTAFATP